MLLKKFFLSFKTRGVAGTIKRIWPYLLSSFRWFLDASFDWFHRVDTTGKISLERLRINSNNILDATWYEPVPTLSFRNLMKELKIKFENYIFIDFGSGKGRALFLAADYPFSRVIGVEFSPELHSVCLKNIMAYKSSRQQCFQIESICSDVVDFELPEKQSVLFFYSPFKARVFTKVINNLMQSLQDYPRSVYLVYIGLVPESIEFLKNSNLICREVKLGPDYIRWEKKVSLILHSGIPEK